MTIMSYLYFDSDTSRLVFSGGSVDSTMKYFVTNKWIVLFLYLSTIFILVFYRKKVKQMLIYFIISFSLWFLSGRVIGVHYTGEIITGWFYLQTNKVILWEADKCTDDIIKNTSTENLFLFNLKFENACKKENIYIGPFIISDLKKYFGNEAND